MIEPPPDRTRSLERELGPLRERLARHPLGSSLRTEGDVRSFLEQHIFAVWDFMVLLKALQWRLSWVGDAWLPVGTPEVRRFVNEVVLAEESDRLADGRVRSHFELYREALAASGAEAGPIDRLFESLRAGVAPESALERCGASPAARRFVGSTLALVRDGSTAALLGAFTYGREDVIPDLFRSLVAELSERFPGRWALLQEYLSRHVELDRDQHSPLARRTLEIVCGTDDDAWVQAADAAREALQERLVFWDALVPEAVS